MIYHLHFHEKVNDDFTKAASYCAEVSTDTLKEFKRELLICYEKILIHPKNYFVLQNKHEIRRCVLNRFSYMVNYFLKDNTTISILGIIHQKQKPGSWKKRL